MSPMGQVYWKLPEKLETSCRQSGKLATGSDVAPWKPQTGEGKQLAFGQIR